MSDFEIDLPLCRGRQQRLLDVLQQRGIDLAIFQRLEHIQWLTGVRFPWTYEPAAALWADGHCILVAPSKRLPAAMAADELVAYEGQWLYTLRNDQRQASSAELLRALGTRPRPQRVAVEYSCYSQHLANGLPAEISDIEPTMFELRRRKDADELALLRKAIAATGKMYERAREIAAPGINELAVFNELQTVAVEECGEMLTATGNDYVSGARGGPPRNRIAQDGELLILDLGPAFRGYFADNCRAIAVNKRPTDRQLEVWERIAAVFPYIERTVKPGVRCRSAYQGVKQMLDDFMPGSFDHHLGHGIGLYPHEGPHLNPNPGWNDSFAEGDVIAVEPGLYSPELQAGIRLENNYLVTAAGVELLSDFPLEL